MQRVPGARDGSAPVRASAPPAKRVVKGDVTGDGVADVVVAAKTSPTLYVLPGGGGRAGVIDWSGGVPANSDSGRIADLASADYDGDGRTDVALGTPAADEGRAGSRGGRVTVLYGGSAPPYLSTRTILDQNHPPLAHPGDVRQRIGGSFGATLAAGDFNADHYPDLAVTGPGAPGTLAGPLPHDPRTGEGTLSVFYGGPRGLTTPARSCSCRAGTACRPVTSGTWGRAT